MPAVQGGSLRSSWRLVIGAIVAGILGAASSARGENLAFREFTSDHFVVRADLDDAAAAAVLRTLEESRAAMLALVWGGAPGPAARTPVIYFASSADLALLVGRTFGGIYVDPAWLPPTIVAGGSGFDPVGNLKHELAHQLSYWFLRRQPAWYREGLACFLESVQYDAERREAYAGAPSLSRHYEAKFTGILPMNQLFREPPEGGAAYARFQASSWTLVHYLFSRRLDSFQRFQGRLASLEAERSAWLAEFPDLDPGRLLSELERYPATGIRAIPAARLAPWNGRIQTRSVSEAEWHGMRAFLLAFATSRMTTWDPTKMMLEANQALRFDPTNIEALMLAFYHGGIVDETVRAELARRASQAHPSSWRAWLMIAHSSKPGDSAALGAFSRALAIAPEEPQVLATLAWWKLGRGQGAEALAISTKAIARRLTNDDLLTAHTAALASVGRCDEATQWATALSSYLPPEAASNLVRDWRTWREGCLDVADGTPQDRSRR